MIKKYITQEKDKNIALITILIIILLSSIFRINKANNIKYYRNKEKLMRKAAINYFNDYQSYLPNKNGETKIIVLSSLIKEKYLEKITDIKDNECDSIKSYVKVTSNGKNKYIYYAHLDCPSYQTKK